MIAGQELHFCDARGQETPPAGWHLNPWGKLCREAPRLVLKPVSAGVLPARCHSSWLCLLSRQWLNLSKSHSPHCFHGSKAAMTISLKNPVHSRGSEILLYFSCPFFSLKNLSLKEIQRGLLFPENREKSPVLHLLLKPHFVVVKLPFSLKKKHTKKHPAFSKLTTLPCEHTWVLQLRTTTTLGASGFQGACSAPCWSGSNNWQGEESVESKNRVISY